MKRALLYLTLIPAITAVGYWLWSDQQSTYRSMGDCGLRPTVETAEEAITYAERMVQHDDDLQRVSGIKSFDNFKHTINCAEAICSATTDGIYWTVWFKKLPPTLSDTWGGRVQFTRCRDHLRIWGA